MNLHGDFLHSGPATVSHLNGLKADLLGAIGAERASLQEQLVVLREDLFAIMARLPGGTPVVMRDSDDSSRRSHGSLLSEESGSEEEWSGSEPSLKEFDGNVGIAATCPELGELEEESPLAVLEHKAVTCPTLEDVEGLLAGEGGGVPTLPGVEQAKPKKQRTRRFTTSKHGAAAVSEDILEDVASSKSSDARLTNPRQDHAASSSTDPPAVLLETPFRQTEEERPANLECMTLPGQPGPSEGTFTNESFPPRSSNSMWLPGHVESQPGAAASSAAASSASGNFEERGQEGCTPGNVARFLERGSDARVESMPELPELGANSADSDETETKPGVLEPHRHKRKMLTYPMLVQPSDSEDSETDLLLTERKQEDMAGTSDVASSRATPTEEVRPLAVVPTAQQQRAIGLRNCEKRPSGSSSSFMDFRSHFDHFKAAMGISGPASLIGTSRAGSSSGDTWSYLALRRTSKGSAGIQDMEQLEQRLSQALFTSQNLISKTPSPVASSALKPRVSRFSLPSEKSRLRGRLSGRRSRRSNSSDLQSSSSTTSSRRLDSAAFASDPVTSRHGIARGAPGRKPSASSGSLGALSIVTASTRHRSTTTASSPRGGAPSTTTGRSFAWESFTSGPAGGLTKRGTTFPSPRQRKHQSMEAVRHEHEQDIVKSVQDGRHVSFSSTHEEVEAVHSQSTPVHSFSAPPRLGKAPRQRLMGLVAANISARICGILPWSTKFKRASLAYQAFLLLVLSAILLRVSIQIFQVYLHIHGAPSLLRYSERPPQMFLALCLDFTTTLGAIVGVLSLGALRTSKTPLEKADKVLCNYSIRNELQHGWNTASRRDILVSLILYVCIVLCRIAAGYALEDHIWGCFPQTVSFAFTALVTMGLVGHILHTCRGLVSMVDAFCQNVVHHPDFGTAVREWGMIQAILRGTSSVLQRCFVALVTVAVVTVLVTFVDVTVEDLTYHEPAALTLIPMFLLALAILRISAWAAQVTDKCQRVPRFVNSLSVGTNLDVNRMYTVDYIVHSQAGFYVFEMRLTGSTLMKAMYIAGAIIVGIATQLDLRSQ